MNKILEKIAIFIGVAAIIIVSYWLGQQAYDWMPVAATVEAQHVDDLFSFLVALGAFVFFSVVGMIIFSIITCRAAADDYSEGHPSRGNNTLEFLWTAAPTVLVLWIAWQNFTIYKELDIEGLGTIMDSNASTNTSATLVAQTNVEPIEEIKVNAKQWEWTFYYPQADITTGELHLPQNKPVRLIFESEDVIHGFYVPEFRFKQDMIPGHIIDFTFTPITVGKYRLHDSQFSGTYFAVMEADVYVDSPDAYSQWLQSADSSIFRPNIAAAEYSHEPQQLIKSHWKTVEPYTHMMATKSKK